nr:hypothetical protein CFP56_71265 [Quercus suber]
MPSHILCPRARENVQRPSIGKTAVSFTKCIRSQTMMIMYCGCLSGRALIRHERRINGQANPKSRSFVLFAPDDDTTCCIERVVNFPQQTYVMTVSCATVLLSMLSASAQCFAALPPSRASKSLRLMLVFASYVVVSPEIEEKKVVARVEHS